MRAKRDRRELVERNVTMLVMRRQSMALKDIAAHFGVSIVRVHVLVKREEQREALRTISPCLTDSALTEVS